MKSFRLLLVSVLFGYGVSGFASWSLSPFMPHSALTILLFFVLSGVLSLLVVWVANLVSPEAADNGSSKANTQKTAAGRRPVRAEYASNVSNSVR